MKTTRLILSVIITVVYHVTSVWAQTLPTAMPEEVGLSSARLDRLTSVMQTYVDDNQVAGGVGVIVRHGKVAYLHAFGMSDRAAGKQMKTDSIFRIASMSKAVTSLAVMILFEEGHFLLDEPVSRYIPAFNRDMKVLVPIEEGGDGGKSYRLESAKKPITIRQLLTHTSGLTYSFFGQEHISDIYRQAGITEGLTNPEGTISDMVEKLATRPLISQPGEKWQYGLSTDVLGYLIEVVSGRPLDVFLRERIFEPLEMHDTYFYLPQDKVQRLATVYTPNDNGGIEPLNTDRIEIGSLVFSTTYPYKKPEPTFLAGVA
jgi:CubicO group peptidase (beta-lactamase class C family)